MKRAFLVVAAPLMIGLAGCTMPGTGGDATGTAPSAAPSAGASAGAAAPGAAGALPVVCDLHTSAEVAAITGVTPDQVDKDDAKAANEVRSCQWQGSGADVLISVSRTTKQMFKERRLEGTTIPDLGLDAYQSNLNTYVLAETKKYGTVMIDVDVRSDKAKAQEIAFARKTLAKISE